jgi:hypothetical protein
VGSVASRHPFVPVALRVTALVLLAIAVSVVASPLAGGLLVAVGLVLLITYEATRPSGMLRAAAREPHPHGGARHVVVVADAPLAGDEVEKAIRGVAGPGAQLDVLAPVLVSHLHFVTSDHDAETRDAHARLQASLAWAAEHGFSARGEVGDDEPATAMADELRDFGADAVVIVTGAERRFKWAEARELDRARAELDVPVVHVSV